MDDGDLWGSNQKIDWLSSEGYYHTVPIPSDATDYDDGDLAGGNGGQISTWGRWYNLLDDDNFFSQVWQKTLGGTIPFIFQPDAPVLNTTTEPPQYEGGNNNPDQFAICRIANNSLKATQTAFNVYDISLKIEEVW